MTKCSRSFDSVIVPRIVETFYVRVYDFPILICSIWFLIDSVDWFWISNCKFIQFYRSLVSAVLCFQLFFFYFSQIFVCTMLDGFERNFWKNWFRFGIVDVVIVVVVVDKWKNRFLQSPRMFWFWMGIQVCYSDTINLFLALITATLTERLIRCEDANVRNSHYDSIGMENKQQQPQKQQRRRRHTHTQRDGTATYTNAVCASEQCRHF